MSLVIHFHERLSCPFFRCDTCGERILAPEEGMAAWFEDDWKRSEGTEIIPYHVHKGACLDKLESYKGQRWFMTDELLLHAANLMSNSGIRSKDIEEWLAGPTWT